MNKNIINTFNFDEINLNATFNNALSGSTTVSDALNKIDQYNITKNDELLYKDLNTYEFESEIPSISFNTGSYNHFKIIFNFVNRSIPNSSESGLRIRFNNDSRNIYSCSRYTSYVTSIGSANTGYAASNILNSNEIIIEDTIGATLTTINANFVGEINLNTNVNSSRLCYINSINARINGTAFFGTKNLYNYNDTTTPITTINLYTYHLISGVIKIVGY